MDAAELRRRVIRMIEKDLFRERDVVRYLAHDTTLRVQNITEQRITPEEFPKELEAIRTNAKLIKDLSTGALMVEVVLVGNRDDS